MHAADTTLRTAIERNILVVHRVTKTYGAQTVLDQVDLEIRAGERFCLLGASGSGKSTLLRIIAGLDLPDTGKVVLDGEDITRRAPYERPVNMMFQSYALFPHYTVRNNIAFGLRQEKLSRSEIDTRVAEVLALVQLEEFADRKPMQLSGGQRQRVALARSLAKHPKVMLLDEPLGALDKKLREQTQFELMQIQERLGTTFIIVTHDQQEAMTLATRIGIMRRGRIEQIDTPAGIYENPGSRFVADFIGSANLIETSLIARHADGMEMISHTLGATLVSASQFDVSPGTTLWCAIRPERIRLLPPDNKPITNTVPGIVREIAYRGDHTVFLVLAKNDYAFRVVQSNLEANHRWQIGDHTNLNWDAANMKVLDR